MLHVLNDLRQVRQSIDADAAASDNDGDDADADGRQLSAFETGTRSPRTTSNRYGGTSSLAAGREQTSPTTGRLSRDDSECC